MTSLLTEGERQNLSILMVQASPIVGAVEHNLELAIKFCDEAQQKGADLVIFSELFLSGYPPEDLLLKRIFLETCQAAFEKIIEKTKKLDCAVIIGLPYIEKNVCYNAAFVVFKGNIIGKHYKISLPNYDEFDEKRVFQAGKKFTPITYKGINFGLAICEDIWQNEDLCENLKKQGAEMLFVLNGSPYTRSKDLQRKKICKKLALSASMPIFYVNQVGGQDSLVFDGASFSVDGAGLLVSQMPNFTATTMFCSWHKLTKETFWQIDKKQISTLKTDLAADYCALLLGLKDYAFKNGFKNILLGLSGGIDSALCLALAVDAFGPEAVDALMLPFHYTSHTSLEDAEKCALLTGCNYETLPIESTVRDFLANLAPLFQDCTEDVTEENLQSRIRGVYLMALSNKFQKMLITTGNKSEMAVGYATLYGDMNGSYNPIKDLYKTEVYALAKWRNQNWLQEFKGPHGIVIAENILTKSPSAELRPNQTDQDSLPPYEILDKILYYLVEKDLSINEITALGFQKETIKQIEKLLYRSEFKRYQAPPGPKISDKSFNRDRRYPMTNYFLDCS